MLKINMLLKFLLVLSRIMKILVNQAGFIGSHLCEALLANNNKVTCLDNLYTGNKENIKNLISNPNQ